MRTGVASVLGQVSTPAAVFGSWQVGTPQRQHAVAEAIAGAWRRRPWPGPGLRSYAVLAADDGTTLLHFSQVDDLEDVPAQDLTWKQEVDAAVPGIERTGVSAGVLRRSTPAYGPAAEAACAVLVTRIFDGPDAERANRLVDAMFESSAETPAAEGLLSAHFYVSPDGATVLNYALWASADAHRQAIENRPAELEANAQWQQAHACPGLLSTSFQRFRPLLRLAPTAR
ncbi:antibiotic biosynthesis monooxygenase [Streptomyces tubbatahanensis]|uniref:Antibiotic biosynthesis monooxygenase n=1 Tax=Streptomyces tubbatahanensis TaxID=2923272 RepID=A0ABY3XLI5_9ACTN|nr:antibiotic biosynthesis monooxygenase [Streptomyces tubbatahanensis]UNS95273.1 antibiotic biosynthesis monooxygenase [Streptomyces tubbatahanensis]